MPTTETTTAMFDGCKFTITATHTKTELIIIASALGGTIDYEDSWSCWEGAEDFHEFRLSAASIMNAIKNDNIKLVSPLDANKDLQRDRKKSPWYGSYDKNWLLIKCHIACNGESYFRLEPQQRRTASELIREQFEIVSLKEQLVQPNKIIPNPINTNLCL